MAYDLSSSGLNLRTLTPKEYGQLIDDLNYNFVQILNLPGFKGRPGASITGATGIGIRGSKWIFVKLSDMTAQYGVTVTSQVTLTFINTVFADNATVFYSTIYIPDDDELLLGDILVLPSGQLIELAEVDDGLGGTTIEFIDTGVTFAQVSSITEEQVIQIFSDLFAAGNTGEGAFREFNAVAKNNTDASPALNQNVNNDSVIDVVVPNSGPGAALPTRKFISAAESIIGDTTAMCLISGSATRYHELIQATQNLHTNNYAPGIDDFAANVILQNSYKNGIIFGHKDSESIRQFGRLYRSTNATILTSSYSPLESEYSDVKLFDTKVLIRSLAAEIDAPLTDINSDTLNSKFFSFAGTEAHLANVLNASLRIYASNGIYLENLKNASILSTDANGKIVDAVKILTAYDPASTNTELYSAAYLSAYIIQTADTLDDLNDRVTVLESADDSVYFSKKSYISATTNLNTLTSYGTYVVGPNISVTNQPPGTSGSVTVDRIVNVYIIDQSASIQKGMQEVSWIDVVVPGQLYPNSNKWIRSFTISSGIATFGSWSCVVTSGKEPQAIAPIEVSGTFGGGDLEIQHSTSPAISTSNASTSRKFIKDVVLDEYGHIAEISSETVPETVVDDDIVFQCVVQDTSYNSIVYGGSNIPVGHGIDPEGSINSSVFNHFNAYNVGAVTNVSPTQSVFAIKVAFDTQLPDAIYDVNVTVVVQQGTSGFQLDDAQLAYAGSAGSSITWAVSRMTKLYCQININEWVGVTQGALFIITGKRLKYSRLLNP